RLPTSLLIRRVRRGEPQQEIDGLSGEGERQLFRRRSLPQPSLPDLPTPEMPLAPPTGPGQEPNAALAQMILEQLDGRPAQARRRPQSADPLQGAVPGSTLQQTLQEAQQVRFETRNGSHELARAPRRQIPTACFAGKPLTFNSRPDSRISSVFGSSHRGSSARYLEDRKNTRWFAEPIQRRRVSGRSRR